MTWITNRFFSWCEIGIKTMILLLLLMDVGAVRAQRNELVMATTFSPGAIAWIIQRWQTEPESVMIRTLNRTSASLEQLLDTANVENVDLILTSSPMLLQHLQEHQKLAPFDDAPAESQNLVPESIRATSVAVAISGFGLLINRPALSVKHLPAPADWDDLALPIYQDALLMSSPSRSDTNHLMVESLLQQKGWVKGWETLLTSAGNLVTISSRSFGVADKIKSGLGVAGPVIDNYANLLLNDPHISFTYFPGLRYPHLRCNSQEKPTRRCSPSLYSLPVKSERTAYSGRCQYRKISGDTTCRRQSAGNATTAPDESTPAELSPYPETSASGAALV